MWEAAGRVAPRKPNEPGRRRAGFWEAKATEQQKPKGSYKGERVVPR